MVLDAAFAPQANLGLKILSFFTTGAFFLITLFLKLCYSTALYATLAEISRRIALFRRTRRPALRALLLLPAVVVFCTAILFALNLWRVVFGSLNLKGFAQAFNPMDILWVFLRAGFFLGAVVLGGALGLMVANHVTLGRDRFGGVLYKNRGRYLAFWFAAFSVCGLFRLLPWGFVTYWTVWVVVLAACLVTAAHWSIYAKVRSVAAAPAPGLPAGGEIAFTLAAREAVALSALLRGRAPRDAEALARSLADPDPSWLAHPAWTAELRALVQDPPALGAALEGLSAKGLAAKSGKGWTPAGPAARLRLMGFAETAAGLTVRKGGAARTVVLHRQGPTVLLLEPGPATLGVREFPRGADAVAALAGAAEGHER